MDLFDYKPKLQAVRGIELPDSIRKGQRLTGMTATQSSFPMVPSILRFNQHGDSGAWVSEVLPHTAKVADQLCFIKSMHTEAINHDPAITFFQTGAQLAGRPSIGSWLVYGLGSESKDLPGFVVMITQGGGDQGQGGSLNPPFGKCVHDVRRYDSVDHDRFALQLPAIEPSSSGNMAE